MESRNKILDKAKKLKELADRGIDGEKDTAIRMLNAYKKKHKILDIELTDHKIDESTFRGYTKEQIYAMMAEELKMQGMYVAAKGYYNLMKNQEKIQQFRTVASNKQKLIRWEYNEKNFSFSGHIGSRSFFDIQQTRSGAMLYRAGLEKLKKELSFKSVDEAKAYCEKIRSSINIHE